MEIQIKESTTIHPAQETARLCLRRSILDLLVPVAHVPAVYFFRQPNNSFNFFEADLLKEALSKVLVPFYPVAGRLTRDETGRIEINCNGEGVLFIEAETSSVIDDLGDFESSLMLLKLAPTVDYTKDISSYPLLLTQVTRFKCGGVCLGFSIHHSLGDATSTFQFMNGWAEMTRGVPISIQPFIDPMSTLIDVAIPTSPKFHHSEYDPPPSMNTLTQNIEFQSSPEPSSSAILNLSLDQINTLKTKSKEDRTPTVRYTTFEILAAHIWRCLCKVRGLSDDQASKLHIPVNGRFRLSPPLPSGYVGNVIFTTTSIGLSGDIQSEPLNFTVERIHEALKRMNDEYLKSALAYLSQLPDPTVLNRGSHIFKCPNLNISNLFHMPVYDTNFGWGCPIFFRSFPILDGVTHIFPSPRNDGSVYLVINLETRHFQHFKKLFYEILLQ